MSTATSMSNHPQSLLFPPNPSLSPQQPAGSILLNRNECPIVSPTDKSAAGGGGAGPHNVLSTIRSSFAWKDHEPGRGRPPAAALNANRDRHPSVSSVVSSTSGTSMSSEYEPSPPKSQCIRFAPLPHTGLSRTKSITLGVAARSNLLRTQGTAAAPRGKGAGGGCNRKVMMTDAEWEEYKRRFENPENQPPELHELVKKGTKKLWNKARSLSSSSGHSQSTASTRSSSTSPTDFSTHDGSTTHLVSSSDTDLPSGGEATLPAEYHTRSRSAGAMIGGGSGGGRQYGRHGVYTVAEDVVMETDEEWPPSDVSSIAEDEEMEDGSTGGNDFRASPSSSSPEEEEEEEEAAPLPAYLQSDLNAERRHFHEHTPAGQAIDADVSASNRNLSPHDRTTKSRAFDAVTDQAVEHETLRRHLKALDLHHHSFSEEGDGDATPRGRSSPPPGVAMRQGEQ